MWKGCRRSPWMYMKRNLPSGLPRCSEDTLRALLSLQKHSVSYRPRFRAHCQAEGAVIILEYKKQLIQQNEFI